MFIPHNRFFPCCIFQWYKIKTLNYRNLFEQPQLVWYTYAYIFILSLLEIIISCILYMHSPFHSVWGLAVWDSLWEGGYIYPIHKIPSPLLDCIFHRTILTMPCLTPKDLYKMATQYELHKNSALLPPATSISNFHIYHPEFSSRVLRSTVLHIFLSFSILIFSASY